MLEVGGIPIYDEMKTSNSPCSTTRTTTIGCPTPQFLAGVLLVYVLLVSRQLEIVRLIVLVVVVSADRGLVNCIVSADRGCVVCGGRECNKTSFAQYNKTPEKAPRVDVSVHVCWEGQLDEGARKVLRGGNLEEGVAHGQGKQRYESSTNVHEPFYMYYDLCGKKLWSQPPLREKMIHQT